jgi:hypothetical protein
MYFEVQRTQENTAYQHIRYLDEDRFMSLLQNFQKYELMLIDSMDHGPFVSTLPTREATILINKLGDPSSKRGLEHEVHSLCLRAQ